MISFHEASFVNEPLVTTAIDDATGEEQEERKEAEELFFDELLS